jgi:hypothetical protein
MTQGLAHQVRMRCHDREIDSATCSGYIDGDSWLFKMRIFFRFPRVFGVSPGVSFGPEDFRQGKTAPRTTSRHADSDFAIVYAIKGDHNRVKIGVTQNPRQRMLALKTASPFPLYFAFLGITDTNGYAIERAAHDRLAPFREGSTEWFACSPELAGAAIMASAARDALKPIIAKVWRHYQATGIRCRTVTLKVKFADFQQITRSKSVGDAIDNLAELERLSLGLLEPLLPTEKGVRLLGISLSSLTHANVTGHHQLSLVL